MSSSIAVKKSEFDLNIERIAKEAKLDSWNSFIEELKIPSELFPAIASSRPELVRLARPRALNPEEAEALYKLIAGLLETNRALQGHAAQLAVMAKSMSGLLKGLQTSLSKIVKFANFQHDQIADDDTDDE